MARESQLLMRIYETKISGVGKKKKKKNAFITAFFQAQNFRSVLSPRKRAQHGNVWVSRDPLKYEVPGKM